MLIATDAYERREHAAFWRTGLVTAAIYNTAPNRRKSARILKPDDFLPHVERPKREQSVAEMAATLKALTIALGGTVTA